MRKNFKYYLVYFLIFIISASVAAAIAFAYDFDIVKTLNQTVAEGNGGGLSFPQYIVFAAELLAPLVLTFFMSFTLYACFVAGASSLYIGARLGILVIRYARSGLNPFTHIAAFMFLLFFCAVLTYASTKSALYRNTLISTAPSPRDIIRAKGTRPLLYSYLTAAFVMLAELTALYFFIVYFPL